jgi:hypothetical protein
VERRGGAGDGLSTWGRLGGEKLDLARHEPATFHHLPPTNTRWTQRIVASCQYRALPTKRQGSRCSAHARIASFPPLRPPPPLSLGRRLCPPRNRAAGAFRLVSPATAAAPRPGLPGVNLHGARPRPFARRPTALEKTTPAPSFFPITSLLTSRASPRAVAVAVACGSNPLCAFRINRARARARFSSPRSHQTAAAPS